MKMRPSKILADMLMRGIKQDTEQLHERIVERIEEYAW